MIRVLIVDDSTTARLLVRSVVETDLGLVVVGEARTGEEAVHLCPKLKPDIITMDIHMPGMDGYEAIRHIMSESPCPILVLTGIESDGLLDVSFKALSVGALMVLAKPRGLPADDPEAQNLIAQIKSMAAVKVVRRPLWLQPRRDPPSPAARLRQSLRAPARRVGDNHELARREPVKIISIGASTGGPPALQAIFNSLSPNLPVPIVVVQHISRGFVSGLANWLSKTSPMRCEVASHNQPLQPGTVYFAPDSKHLLVSSAGVAWLNEATPVDGHRPSATVLFESLARNYGPAAIGVLLTGMGQDGAQGLKLMRQAGAHTVAQDEATSVVFGMPKTAVDIGAAIEQLPLEQIAGRLNMLVEASRNAKTVGSTDQS